MLSQSNKSWIKIFLTALFLFIPFSNYAASLDELAGPPFSDPTVTQDMDDKWKEKPIQYETPDAKADLVVSLNQQFYEYILPYIIQYGEQNNLNIVVKRGTCGLSAAMLSSKAGDMGALCCPPAKTDRLPGLHYFTLGVHPIAILVHPDNPIESVSRKDLRKIFMGEMVNWAELGWDNGRIEPVVRLHCKKRPGHWRLILDNEDLFSTSITEVGAIEDMFSLVAKNPTAIGYEALWLSIIRSNNVKLLKIDGSSPEELDKTAQGIYQFYRVISMTSWQDPHLKHPHSEKLIEFLNNQVERNGESYGIISVNRLKKAGWKFKEHELIGEPD